MTDWPARLREAAQQIDNDGVSSQVGLTAEECRDLALYVHRRDSALRARIAECEKAQADIASAQQRLRRAVTAGQIANFKLAIATYDREAVIARGVDPILADAQLEGLKSMLESFEAEHAKL